MKFKILLLFVFSLGCRALFGQGNFTTSSDSYWCGNTKIVFNQICANPQPGIQFVHVHENEKTAAEVAEKMLEKVGSGCFVTWQCNNDRYVNFILGNDSFRFDPNRIYTAKGLAATLQQDKDSSVIATKLVREIAGNFLKKFVDSQRLVVALHNNTDGGGFTIHSFAKNGPYAKDTKKIYVNKAKDEDDFFLTTDTAIFKFLKKKGFNVLLQNNASVTDDGSLSVYAAKKHIAYLNVEAQAGHFKEQMQMMDAVQELIKAQFNTNQ